MDARLTRIRHLATFLGVRGALWHVLRRLVSPIYYSELLYITNGYLVEVPDDRESGPGAINTDVFESVQELLAVRDRLHPDLDLDLMLRHFESGTDRAWVALTGIEGENGSVTYFSLATYDRGGFRMPEYHFGGPLADHIYASYEWEIVPEYRGRRLSYRGRYGYWAYPAERGMWASTGVIRSHNTPSLRSSYRQKDGTLSWIPGSFRLTRWFGGRWVQAPPWDEVRALIEAVPEGYEPPAFPPPVIRITPPASPA
ncbi:MAG: hypothetical protein R3C39_00105 [Dehalococcoidia bacterium]